MNPNQPGVSSSEKSGMFQPQPPEYQNNPQPILQAAYTQSPYPGQSVVIVQPTVYVAAPLTNPEPDYLYYSIFTLVCCCSPLGIAALVYSLSTRNANHSGQQALAAKNSTTARNLNHTAVGLSLLIITLIIIYEVFLNNNNTTYNRYP